MDMKPPDRDVKEVIEELNVPFDDIYCLSDGTYGYWCILTSDLEEEQESILSGLGFKQIESDLWIKRIEGPDSIPEYKIIELERTTQERLWSKILELINAVNSICLSENRDLLFKPTTNFIKSSNKLKGFLCINYEDFGIFCEHLYKCIEESSGSGKRIPESFRKADFYIFLRELRNHFKHDREHGEKKDLYKKYKKVSKIFLDILHKKWPVDASDFIEIELELLKKCREWLKNLAKSLV